MIPWDSNWTLPHWSVDIGLEVNRMSAADTIHFTMNKPVGYIDVAITFAFNESPFVFGLTAPLDQELPTWRIKSMSLRRVGPEHATGMQFLGAVEITRTLLQTSNAGATRHTRKCEPFLAEIQRTSTKLRGRK